MGRPTHGAQPRQRGAGGRRGVDRAGEGASRSNAGLNRTLLLPPSVDSFSSGLPLLRKLCCGVIAGKRKGNRFVSGLLSEWGGVGGDNIYLEILS